jgi:hypothetical protein
VLVDDDNVTNCCILQEILGTGTWTPRWRMAAQGLDRLEQQTSQLTSHRIRSQGEKGMILRSSRSPANAM